MGIDALKKARSHQPFVDFDFQDFAGGYLRDLQRTLEDLSWDDLESLYHEVVSAIGRDATIHFVGNGGSAANAVHIANDFIYGIGACGPQPYLTGVRVEALTANTGVITCLANDTGYENIYSKQLEVKGRKDDLLIALSGSGNSPNIVKAIEIANKLGMKTFAILGFDGGKCKEIAYQPIHINISDMQIAEDSQVIIFHMCMQWIVQKSLASK